MEYLFLTLGRRKIQEKEIIMQDAGYRGLKCSCNFLPLPGKNRLQLLLVTSCELRLDAVGMIRFMSVVCMLQLTAMIMISNLADSQ